MSSFFEKYLGIIGYDIPSSDNELGRIQGLSNEGFSDWQNDRKRFISNYHYSNNEFYYSKVGKKYPVDWSDFPILSKSDYQIDLSKIISETYSLKELYIITPLGFVGALITGLTHGTIFGYGAVYATAKNLSTFEISIFMVIITAFGALSQWPIGWLSDKIDRRIILIGVTLLASILSIIIIVSSYLSLFIFFVLLALYSSMCLPMYSLCVAHTNDFLNPDEIVSASAAIAILIGIGAIFGPITVSFFMYIIGADGFFYFLFVFHILLGLFGLYRMGKRSKPTDLESQYYPLPRNISSAGMELNPKVDIKNED